MKSRRDSEKLKELNENNAGMILDNNFKRENDVFFSVEKEEEIKRKKAYM